MVENVASNKVITKCGGQFIETYNDSMKGKEAVINKYYVYKESCYKTITGVFTKLDTTYKRISIVKTKINIEDIYDIEIKENTLSL